MKQYGELLEGISRDLNIMREDEENSELWKARIVYSVVGEMARASVFDKVEDTQDVSVTHIIRRCQRTFRAYKELYPELSEIMLATNKEFSDEIYEIYLNTGFFYHTPYRLLPGAEKRVNISGVELIRGGALNEVHKVSGLGAYKLKKGNDEINDLLSMFQISKHSLNKEALFWINNVKWKSIHSNSNIEYLKIKPTNNSFWRNGYWQNTPDLDMTSLLRMGEENRVYYLYKANISGLYVSELPAWIGNKYEYRNIANALLSYHGFLPSIKVFERNYTVVIKQDYLLPPSILNFLKLYSWPESFYKKDNNFSRVMSKDMFSVFEKILNVKGIEVTMSV